MPGGQDLSQLADQHAKEAERLLAKRFGWINDTIEAQVHATLAVYYATEDTKDTPLQSP